MTKKIIIGSRGSKLALLYAQNAKDAIIQNTNLGDEDIVIKSITTKGDQVKDVRVSDFGGKGLFSSNIEKELKDKINNGLMSDDKGARQSRRFTQGPDKDYAIG